MMALHVDSRYKKSPNDLQLMADAPAHHLLMLLGMFSLHESLFIYFTDRHESVFNLLFGQLYFTKLYTGPVFESKNTFLIFCVIQVHFLIFVVVNVLSVFFFHLNFMMVQCSLLHNQIPLQYTHVNELILNNFLMITVKKD